MYGVAAPIWNKVASQQPLQTPFGREMFNLDQDKLNQALEAREAQMQAHGVPSRVASAYLTVAPLLWEKAALASFARTNPKYATTFPEVVSPSEAALLATKEYSLTAPQQKLLSQLLTTPPT